MSNRTVLTAASVALGLMAFFWTTPVTAFEGFDDGGGAGLPGCAACHASLANFGPAHPTHAALSNNDCNSCHGQGPQNNPPLANCVRCHGRDADAGGDNISPGLARGLRQHHVVRNAAACGACHGDALGAPGVGEDVLPSFYPAARNGAGLDSCDGSEEQFASASVSLDNDGDGLTDGADPDCASNQPPTADPNGPYNGSVGTPVSFDGTGSSDPDGTIAAYDWNFGDGNVGTGATPTHTYASADTFTVTLTVTDDAGASDSQSTTATITAQPLPPIADAGGPYTGIVGSPVGFDGTGSTDPDGTIASYDWSFGDGGTGTGPTPDHTYSVDGTYTVTLTVTDSDGLTDTDTASATINPAGGNIPPVANANGPYSGTEGVAVQFSSAGSADPDGAIVAFAWEFGDGGTSAIQNPVHTYAASGTYTVRLTVTDDAGDTGTDATTATIEVATGNMPPSADANGPYSGFVGDAVLFDGSGSTDADGAIVRYDWDFGDGNAAADAGPAPSHAYDSAGTYTVTLTVTDDAGATDSVTSAVEIRERMPVTEGETQYMSYCAACHGDPWTGPAVDPGLAGAHRVTGARACSIDGSIFGTYVFPDGAPGMEFLQALANDGTVDTEEIAKYLNSHPVTGEQYYVTACAGCHGYDGEGGRTGEAVDGEDFGEIAEAIEDERAMRYLACLPESDIRAMTDFLAGHDDDGDSDGDSDSDSDSDSDEDSDSDGDSDGNGHDSDDDGMSDDDERAIGTDPNDPDTDDDGVSDGDEVSIFHTNPLVADRADAGSTSTRGGGSGGLPLLALIAMAGLLRLSGRRDRRPGTPR